MPTFHPQAERHMKDETQDAVGSHEVGWVWGMFMKVSMGGGVLFLSSHTVSPDTIPKL